jgi:hypothetical protein
MNPQAIEQRNPGNQAPARRRRADRAMVASYIHALSPRHRTEREARGNEPVPEAARP